jgi:hypothetical protein
MSLCSLVTRPADADTPHRPVTRRLAEVPRPSVPVPARSSSRPAASTRHAGSRFRWRWAWPSWPGRAGVVPALRAAPPPSNHWGGSRPGQDNNVVGRCAPGSCCVPPPPPSGERGELRRKASPPRRPAAARVGPSGQARAPSPARPSWRDAAGIVPAVVIAYLQALTCRSRMRELRKNRRKPGIFAVFGLNPSAASWYTGVPFGAIGAPK